MTDLKHTPFVIGLALLLTFLIYRPGLNGDFLFDDHLNIVQNTALHIDHLAADTLWDASLAGEAGPLKRPISMLSFALNHYLFGLDPYYFKLINLLIHLLNGLGLYLLTRYLLTAARRNALHEFDDKQITQISLAATALWLVHPLNVTSVLYIVQRMNALATLFTIYGLAAYCYGRLKLISSRKGFWVAFSGIALFTPLAALCKENGALLPLYALTIELVIFRFKAFSAGHRLVVKTLWGVFGGTLLIAILALFAKPDIILDSYTGRAFTLTERLLTESRVLCGYIGMILVPVISSMSLFHDDIEISTGLFSPASTAASLAFISGLLVTAWLARKANPFISFGILFFFVGHSLESTVLGLEIAHEHRNYLPQYGILLAVTLYLGRLFEGRLGHRGPVIAFCTLIAIIGGSTFIRTTYWGESGTYILVEAIHKPRSPRAQLDAGILYFTHAKAEPDVETRSRYVELARQHFKNSFQVDPNSVDGLFSLIVVESAVAETVPREYVEELEYRLKEAPFAPNTGNQIHGLITCKMDKLCLVSDEQMGRLLQAALDNPTLKGRARSRVLHEAAKYLFTHVKNYQDAVSLEYQAILERPDSVISRITLVQMLIALGQRDMAKEQFAELQRVNRFGLHSDMVDELRESLGISG